MVKEIETPVFLLTSSFILALFLNFYKFPLLFVILFFLILGGYFFYIKKLNPKLIFWFLFLLLCLITNYYLNFLVNKSSVSINKMEILTKIEKVEPYYKGYINFAYNPSIGNFIFKTDKNYFVPGEVCLLRFESKPFNTYFNPFSSEKEKKIITKGINFELRFLKDKRRICKKEKEFNLEYIRYKIFKFSEKLTPLAKGLVQALVLGVECNLPQNYIEKLKNQGLYHQLAISGFNLAILFGLFYKVNYFFLKFTPLIRTGYPIQNIAYILALPGAFVILFFSGFSPPAFRAFIFLSIFIVSKLFFRNTSVLILLFLTATLILIFQPYLIGNFSFLLSFLATLGLIIGNRFFKNYLKPFIFSFNIQTKIFLYTCQLFLYL